MGLAELMLDRTQLLADLTRDEGFRPYVYDDATGAEVLAGKTLRGHATLAVGWCPETNPCSEELGQMILGYLADDKIATLTKAAPWIEMLPEPQLRAVCNMAYQMGVTGLLKFTTFMGLMQQHRFDEAADDLATTIWFKQATQRAQRIQTLIRSTGAEQ